MKRNFTYRINHLPGIRTARFVPQLKDTVAFQIHVQRRATGGQLGLTPPNLDAAMGWQRSRIP